MSSSRKGKLVVRSRIQVHSHTHRLVRTRCLEDSYCLERFLGRNHYLGRTHCQGCSHCLARGRSHCWDTRCRTRSRLVRPAPGRMLAREVTRR
jgi:hypothetical protein